MMLSVWNEQLAAEGEKIIKYRTDFVKLINDFSAAIQNEISGEKLQISYMPGMRASGDDKDSIYKYLEKKSKDAKLI